MDHPQQPHPMSGGYHPHLGGGGAMPYGGHPGHVPYGYHGQHQGGGGPYGHPGYSQQMQQMGPQVGGVPPLQAFFAPWDPPPPAVAAPQDVELQKRIAKLVEYAAKNGPQFEALMKEKQKENPAYAFLFGGEGHKFYRFQLWVALNENMQPGVPGVGGGTGGVGGGGGTDPILAAAYGQGHGGQMPGGPGAFHEHAQQQQEFYNQSMGMHLNAAHRQPHPQHMHPHMQPHPYDSNYRRLDQQLAEQHQQQVGDHGYGQQVHGGAHPGYGGQVPGGPHQHMQSQHYHMGAAGQVQGGSAGYHMENQAAGGGGGGSLGPPRAGGLPHELGTELISILDNLTGTKESIKSAKMWFMSRIGYAEQLAEAMRDRIRQLEDPERQLHIVYLANDILFNSFNHRTSPSEMDSVAIAFRPVLGSMLSTIYHCRQNTESNQDRLQRILHFWGKMEFFDRDTIVALEHEMLTGVPSAYSAAGASHALSYGMMPPHMGLGHGYYGAPHMGWGGSYVSPTHQQQPGSGVHQQQEEEQRRREEQEEDRDDKGDDGEHDQEKKRQKMEQDWDMEDERRQEEDEQSPPPGDGSRSHQDSAARLGEDHMARKDHNDHYTDSPEGSAGPGKYYPPPGTVTVPYSAGVTGTPGLHASMGVGMGVSLSGFSAGMSGAVAPNSAVSAAMVGMVQTSIPGVPGISAVAVVPQSVTTGPGDKPLPFPLFPPGLIPGMVRKLQVGSGVPYSPLSPLDIPPVIPAPSVPESYILDRVRKFFKEVGEIDPLDADVPEKEATPVRQEREEEEEPETDTGPLGGLGLGMMMVDPETGTLPDGSVELRPGMITSGKLGLGATADPNEITQYDDVYLSYRKQRSTNYHTSLGLRAGMR